jgi:hypothetical protein
MDVISGWSYLSSVTVAWVQNDVKEHAHSNAQTHHATFGASSDSSIFLFLSDYKNGRTIVLKVLRLGFAAK